MIIGVNVMKNPDKAWSKNSVARNYCSDDLVRLVSREMRDVSKEVVAFRGADNLETLRTENSQH